MSNKMLKFVEIGQQTPPKREVNKRKDDFNEIYDEFLTQKAQEQSSRCSQCGVPFCQVHCPLSNNIPDWLKLTAEGRLKEAMNCPKVLTICQKYVEEYVPKIDYVKEIVSLSSLVMEQLQLVLWKNILQIMLGNKVG